MKFCKNCGSENINRKQQTFSNGTDHTALRCNDCQTHLGYAPKNNGFNLLIAKNAQISTPGEARALADQLYAQLCQNGTSIKGRDITITAKVR